MDDETPVAVGPAGVPPLAARALAGLQVGVIGGIVMLLWFGADAWLHREFVGKVPHLFASWFYGERVFQHRLGWITLLGLATLLGSAGLLGSGFGVALPRPPGMLRLFVFALLTAMAWYWASQVLLWRRWLPLIPLYTTPASMFVAHFLYGICLTRYPRALQALRRALDEP